MGLLTLDCFSDDAAVAAVVVAAAAAPRRVKPAGRPLDVVAAGTATPLLPRLDAGPAAAVAAAATSPCRERSAGAHVAVAAGVHRSGAALRRVSWGGS